MPQECSTLAECRFKNFGVSGKLINPVAVKKQAQRCAIEVKHMVEMKVDASELKGDLIGKLSDFLKDKTGGEVRTEGKTVIVKGEGEALSKKYVRITVKKFLHKQELTETFKVIGDEEALKIKERKLAEEED
jgi:hypothetical protein